ncbi:hypothetical protein H8959_002123 [Pygathrix nigripes]
MEIQFNYESQEHHLLSDGENKTKIGKPASEEGITAKTELLTEESSSLRENVLQDSEGREFLSGTLLVPVEEGQGKGPCPQEAHKQLR